MAVLGDGWESVGRPDGVTAASGRRSYRGKRALDLAVVAVTAAPAVVVGAVCAAAVKLTSRGPVLFRQERIGLDGRPFIVLKFRTMVDAPEGNPAFPDPSRITAAGRWLRRLSLDELPQLLNVVKGDMSVVGPRPTFPYQVARYGEVERQRLSVRPGITGLAQVRGRNSIPWSERILHDLEYLRRQSLGLDLKILFWSVGSVVSGSGVSGHPTDDPLAVIGLEVEPPSGAAR